MFAKSTSKPIYWEFVATRSQRDHANYADAISLVLRKFPAELKSRGGCAASGKGWPTFLSLQKFEQLFERRGVDGLTAATFGVDPDLALSMLFSFIPPVMEQCYIRVEDTYWDQVGGLAFINELVEILEFDYGHLHRVPTVTPWMSHYIIDTALTEHRELGPIARFERFRRDWFSWRYREVRYGSNIPFDRPILVTPLTLLRDIHLNAIVENGQTLRQWKESDRHRGSISRANASNYFWMLEDKNCEAVTCDLWKTGFLPCSEYFEVVGWLSEFGLPKLRQIREFESVEYHKEQAKALNLN